MPHVAKCWLGVESLLEECLPVDLTEVSLVSAPLLHVIWVGAMGGGDFVCICYERQLVIVRDVAKDFVFFVGHKTPSESLVETCAADVCITALALSEVRVLRDEGVTHVSIGD